MPISDLSLQPFAGPCVARQRPECVQGGRLLFHFQRGFVAQIADAAGPLAGHERRDLDLQGGDLLPPRLLTGHQVLCRGDVVDTELAEDVLDTRRCHPDAFLGPDASLAAQCPIPLAGFVEVADVHRDRSPFPEAGECK